MNGSTTPAEEDEANHFAMCLLMPGDWLKSDIHKMGGINLVDEKAIKRLADRYKVPHSLMAIRIGQLMIAPRRTIHRCMTMTRIALICALTLLGGGAWAGDGMTQTFVCGPDNTPCNGPLLGPSYPVPYRTLTTTTGDPSTSTSVTSAIAPPKPPECTVTLTLPPGDVPIPERADAEVRHADGGNRSVSVERCKIVVRSK